MLTPSSYTGLVYNYAISGDSYRTVTQAASGQEGYNKDAPADGNWETWLGLTKEIARYVTSTNLEDFPPEAVSTAKDGIVDAIACTLAGSREPLVDILCRYSESNGGNPRATVVGRGIKTSSPEAALLNGATAHAIDYDDVARAMKGHPSVVVLPPALALGEERSATGRDILTAYMIGFEVACSVASGMNDEFYDELGWHPTGPIGALGAVASAAHISKLNLEQTEMALSLAASQASGLRQNFGTMTKPFHAGFAARTGVTSARLAEEGFTASRIGIEGPAGFLQAFSGGGGYDEDRVSDRLGKYIHLANNSVELKKYPCCGSTHLALDGLIPLLHKQRLEPSEVDRVDVMVDFDPPRSLIHDRPKTPLEARFSMQYCVAAALLDRNVGIGSFAGDNVLRPEVQELIPRINLIRNPGFEGQPSWTENYHQILVRMKGGHEFRERVSRVPGRSLPGITPAELNIKFKDCASQALPTDRIDEVLQNLKELEQLESIGHLMDQVRGDTLT